MATQPATEPTEAEPAWGPVVGGLRLGIALKEGQRQHRPGDKVDYRLYLHNASSRPLVLDEVIYSGGEPRWWAQPRVSDARERPVKMEWSDRGGEVVMMSDREVKPYTVPAGAMFLMAETFIVVTSPQGGGPADPLRGLVWMARSEPGRLNLAGEITLKLADAGRPGGSASARIVSGTVPLEVLPAAGTQSRPASATSRASASTRPATE